MRPQVSVRGLKKTKTSEYVVRFGFGGLVALAAAFLARASGPGLAGFFLAFPALLPAGLTLVKQHNGRRAATDDARGAVLGSLALSLFGVIVMLVAETTSIWSCLLLALLCWAALSTTLWWALLKTP